MNIIQWIRINIFGYKPTGLIPSPVDDRDYIYKPKKSGTIKNGVDLRDRFPDVKNQGSRNSCVAEATADLLDYNLKYKKKFKSWDYNTSEAYLWYWNRFLEGTQNKNSGTILRDAFKVLNKYGFVEESRWPWSKGIYTQPDSNTQLAGLTWKNFIKTLPNYYRVYNTLAVKRALSEEEPVEFGMPTDSSYMKLKSSNPYVTNVSGNSNFHAQLIVGWFEENEKTWYIVRNSWGKRFGDNGYSYIEEGLLNKIMFDGWVLK